jgi:hypothetical protein
MTVYCLPPPVHVEAAVQIVEDFIRGQEAAARVDAAMVVVREWIEARRRLNDRVSTYEH